MASEVLSYESIITRPRQGRLWWAICNFVLMVSIIGGAVHYGLQLRRWAWEQADEIHFRISLTNAIKWGSYTNKVGILNVYQKIIDEYGDDNLNVEPGGGRLALDYPPLRLLIMSRWEAWTELHMSEIVEKGLLEERVKNNEPTALSKLDQNRINRDAARFRSNPQWQKTYEFNRPMLELNTACELAGAVAMFLLVHYWLRQCTGAPPRQWVQPLRCAWPALFSALLVWFSPAVIFNAHSYPQWDVWILPPFLLAVYFGMLDLWLISGMLIGVVSMGKGQILMVTPVLIIWQLLMLRGVKIAKLLITAARASISKGEIAPPLLEALRLLACPFGAVLRLGVGIVLAIGLVASPWLTSNPVASTWMIWVGLGLVCLSALFFLRRWSARYIYAQVGILILGMAMTLWPWLPKTRPGHFGLTYLAVIGLFIAARFLPRRWIATWAATAITAALYACVPLFKTSMAWYAIGIKFPTEHWQLLYWCHAMNLGAILNQRFGWEYDSTLNLMDYLPLMQTHFGIALNQFVSQIRFGAESPLLPDWPIIPMRYLMIWSYLFTLLLSGIGMAIQYRRKDRMFFFAMVAPWVLMYALLPQMQNRYSLWAAAFTAATASFSLDGFMLFVLLNGLNWVDTAWDMLYRVQQREPYNPTVVKWMPRASGNEFGGIGPLFPDLGYAVLLIAGIYLYLTLRRDKRPPNREQSPGIVVLAPPALPPTLASESRGFEVQSPLAGAIA